MRTQERAMVGCLLGTAAGDALGLPREGMSSRRAGRMFPDLTRHHFLFGRGMVSDDTEHACLVGEALLRSGGEPDAFGAELGRGLRRWFAGAPAGVGQATARACLCLWAGVPPERSGVWSAGNGPSMRAPLLGVFCQNEWGRLRELVRVSTRITHTDPKAEFAACAVALAASMAARPEPVTPNGFVRALRDWIGAEAGSEEILRLAALAAESAAAGERVTEFAGRIGCPAWGVTGYSLHTVPAVLQVWMRHPGDLRGGLTEMIRAGGDADTTGAILGGLIGARVGREGVPSAWVDGIWEWPRGVAWMEETGRRLAKGIPGTPPPAPFLLQALRNGLFLGGVFGHLLRRALPPY